MCLCCKPKLETKYNLNAVHKRINLKSKKYVHVTIPIACHFTFKTRHDAKLGAYK